MIIDKDKLKKIKDIIDRHYATFTISVLGKDVFTPKELRELQSQGIDIDNANSFLEMAYHHNYLNEATKEIKPNDIKDMERQQKTNILPIAAENTYAVEHLNENAKNLIDGLKQNIISKIEGIIRDENQNYKFNVLMNPNRNEDANEDVKEISISKLKQQLRDYTGEANRSWDTIVRTEISNALGAGSVDRIVNQNEGKDLHDIYVYRINADPANECKYCKQFYVDADGTPAVYRLSTLLGNGSNYGKKAAEWKPVSISTHPNCKDSQPLELRPGWMVTGKGTPTFIGMEKWKEYIKNKVRS